MPGHTRDPPDQFLKVLNILGVDLPPNLEADREVGEWGVGRWVGEWEVGG